MERWGTRCSKSVWGLPSTTFQILKSGAGFTFVELLVTIFFLGLAASSVALLFHNQDLGTLDADAELMQDHLRDAQLRAVSGVAGLPWGIHFDRTDATKPWYALFPGTSYAAASSTYYASTPVWFCPDINDIVFTKLTGRVSTTINIILQLRRDYNSGTQTAPTQKKITITSAGQMAITDTGGLTCAQ